MSAVLTERQVPLPETLKAAGFSLSDILDLEEFARDADVGQLASSTLLFLDEVMGGQRDAQLVRFAYDEVVSWRSTQDLRGPLWKTLYALERAYARKSSNESFTLNRLLQEIEISPEALHLVEDESAATDYQLKQLGIYGNALRSERKLVIELLASEATASADETSPTKRYRSKYSNVYAQARLALGLSQKDLAKHAGIGVQTLVHYERSDPQSLNSPEFSRYRSFLESRGFTFSTAGSPRKIRKPRKLRAKQTTPYTVARFKLGLSVQEVADAVGLSYQTVSRYEHRGSPPQKVSSKFIRYKEFLGGSAYQLALLPYRK